MILEDMGRFDGRVDLFTTFSLEIDKSLDHNLLILVDRIEYEKNDNILIEADEVELRRSFLMCIIEKGDTKSGKYRTRYRVPGRVTTLKIQLLLAKEREITGRARGPGPLHFRFGKKEGVEREVGGDRIPHDYKYNPYRVNPNNEIVFNLAKEVLNCERKPNNNSSSLCTSY